MKKVFVIGNAKKQLTADLMSKCAAFLDGKGIAHTEIYFSQKEISRPRWEEKADMAIVFGGDGTILNSCRVLLEAGVPVMGVNVGHLGYLAAAEPETCINNLQRVLNGDYFIEERATLVAELNGEKYLGINEAVLDRGSAPHLININVEVNGQEIYKVRADGIMVATPTGSTAYNLSAGGPIIVPGAKSLVITPICAHSLAARPIVVADNDVVTLTVAGKSEEPKLSMDGIKVDIDNISKMTVKVGEKTFKLIRTGDNKFFTTLRKKLSGQDV